MEITKEYLVSIIDSTLLKPNATKKDIEFLCEEAVLYDFGAVCIRPCDVEYAANLLKDSKVNVCTVIGFPWGIQTIESKVSETHEVIYHGAREVDMVLNRSYLKDKNDKMLLKEMKYVVLNAQNSYADDVIVKVILETCELTDEEIVKACLKAEKAGANYVKTSTGLYAGATVEAVSLMHKTVPKLGVKAAGGIKTWEDAKKLIDAGATRLGTSSGMKILSEFLTQNQK
jgi:deoxyribose-phosphate aldolase